METPRPAAPKESSRRRFRRFAYRAVADLGPHIRRDIGLEPAADDRPVSPLAAGIARI